MKTSYRTLLTDLTADGWLTIWLNRPESRNALSAEMAQELTALLISLREDRTVRGITLRGAGGFFCSGGDLKGFKSDLQGAEGREATLAASRQIGQLLALLNSQPQVVVIFVEGAAMAGGLGMVCCADIVVVTADAKFALTETGIGIPPAQIAPYIADRVGLPAARRLMLAAARFTGAEAQTIGLADHVIADAGAFAALETEIRASVLRCAPVANAVTKDVLLKSQTLSKDQLWDYAAERFTDCLLGDEGREGIASFIEKRKPSWAVSPAVPATASTESAGS